MIGRMIDASNRARTLSRELGERVLNGGHISREEAMQLFSLESTADIFDLMARANRIRERFKGRHKIHLCSIVNAKASVPVPRIAASARNPSISAQTGSPHDTDLSIPSRCLRPPRKPNKHGVTAVGLVCRLERA